MRPEAYQEIAVHLDKISELFTIPTPDPFAERVRFVPGIESIKADIAPSIRRRERPARITIFLPAACIEPDLARRTREAIRRYCLFQMQQNRRGMKALFKGALLALLVGIIVLTCGLLFLVPLEKALALLPFFNTLLDNGFDIAFWVILWRPIDFFLFDAAPYWREDRLYKRLMATEIFIREEAAL